MDIKVKKEKILIDTDGIEAALTALGVIGQKFSPSSADIGVYVPNEGIYTGRFVLEDTSGRGLTRTFNIFAAPTDLPGGTRTYEDTVKALKQLQGWHGHDGTGFDQDVELYKALRTDTYSGGWVIPPRPMLSGSIANGARGRNTTKVQDDNLLAYQTRGAFKNTFRNSAGTNIRDTERIYWSSTPKFETDVATRPNPEFMCSVDFVHKHEDMDGRDSNAFSCRPIRLVEIKP